MNRFFADESPVEDFFSAECEYDAPQYDYCSMDDEEDEEEIN